MTTIINPRSFSQEEVQALLRSGGTVRYHTHIADMIKEQDVAQHSYNVMWLVYTLTRGEASRELILGAITHDSGERWAGDLPSPTKRTLGIRESFGKFEDSQLVEKTGYVHQPMTPSEERILKIADALEGARFCYHEMSMGNSRVRGILRNFVNYVYEELKPPYPLFFDQDLAHSLLNLYSEGI